MEFKEVNVIAALDVGQICLMSLCSMMNLEIGMRLETNNICAWIVIMMVEIGDIVKGVRNHWLWKKS